MDSSRPKDAFRHWADLDPTISSQWKESYSNAKQSNAAWSHFEPLLAENGYTLWRSVDLDGPPVMDLQDVYAVQTRHGADGLPSAKFPFRPQMNEALNEAAWDRGQPWFGITDSYPMVRGAYDRYDRLVVIRAIGANDSELDILMSLSSPPMRDDPRNRTIPVLDSIWTREWVFIVMPCWNGDPCTGPAYDRVEDYLYTAGQILEGLAFMHSVGIAHMDAHRGNIVLNHFTSMCFHILDGYTPFLSKFNAQFAFIDFGYSMRVPPGSRVPETAFPLIYHSVPEIGWDQYVPFADPRPALQRPDLLHDPYAADIWMIGNVLLQQIKTHDGIVNSWGAPRAERTHEKLREKLPEYFHLIDRMMHRVPQGRPSAAEAHRLVLEMQMKFRSLNDV